MLSKSASYYFDAEAVREPNVGMPADREARTVAPKGNPNRCDDGGRNRVSMRGGQALSYNPAGRNVRSVWNIATQPFAEAHFATMPAALAERCIKAGCPVGGTVLDPFAGAATTLMVADRLQRRSVGIELSPTYCAMAAERLRRDAPLFAGASA
jgi:DNA modification methylase